MIYNVKVKGEEEFDIKHVAVGANSMAEAETKVKGLYETRRIISIEESYLDAII